MNSAQWKARLKPDSSTEAWQMLADLTRVENEKNAIEKKYNDILGNMGTNAMITEATQPLENQGGINSTTP